MVKIFTRGYNCGKEKSNLKNRKVLEIQSREQRKQGRQSKCCGWNLGTCQVEVVRNDKMVIDIEFIHPLLFTFDKLPSLILLVPTYLF